MLPPVTLQQNASMSDLLTAAKGIVTALNATLQNQQLVTGSSSASGVNVATVIKTFPGRIVSINVAVAGSTAGAAYDLASLVGVILGTTTANLICAIPNTVGITNLGFTTTNGISVIPGSGQVISIVYS
jgi:hypothetical protein